MADEAKRLAYNAYHREYRKNNEKWAEYNRKYLAKRREMGLLPVSARKPRTDAEKEKMRLRAKAKYADDEFREAKKLKENARYKEDQAYRTRKLEISNQYYANVKRMKKGTFRTWLTTQTGRNDDVGRFAGDVGCDPNAPKIARVDTWRRYLKSVHADDWAVNAFEDAFKEYTTGSQSA